MSSVALCASLVKAALSAKPRHSAVRYRGGIGCTKRPNPDASQHGD